MYSSIFAAGSVIHGPVARAEQLEVESRDAAQRLEVGDQRAAVGRDDSVEPSPRIRSPLKQDVAEQEADVVGGVAGGRDASNGPGPPLAAAEHAARRAAAAPSRVVARGSG